MVCTDGVAVLFHCRSVRCYYFLLCMPWIDLLFPSYFMYLLSLHMQEAKGNNSARNKDLTWRLCPCHRVPHGFRPWRGLLPLGCGRMHCVFTQAWWEVTAEETPMAHSVPLWCPVLLVPLVLGQQQDSVSIAVSSWHCLCPIAITPLSQDPLCVGQKTACGEELFLSSWHSLFILHVSSIGAEMDQMNGQCPNGDVDTMWCSLGFFIGTSTVQYLY